MGLTLVLRAGGRASRFGRSKQTEGVGPDQSVLLEYSLFDAIRTGFDSFLIVVGGGNENPNR